MSSALGESSVLPIEGPVCKNPTGDRAGEKEESRRAWLVFKDQVGDQLESSLAEKGAQGPGGQLIDH